MTEKQKDRQAIERTRTHWKEDYKKLDLFGGTMEMLYIFNTFTCALCQRHREPGRPYKHGAHCGRCPLRPRGQIEGCCDGSPFIRACAAYRDGDKPAFMAARAAMDKRLGRALERLK